MKFIENNSKKFLGTGVFFGSSAMTFANEHGLPIEKTFKVGMDITQSASRWILVFLVIGAVVAFFKGSKVVGALFGIIALVIVMTSLDKFPGIFNMSTVGMTFIK